MSFFKRFNMGKFTDKEKVPKEEKHTEDNNIIAEEENLENSQNANIQAYELEVANLNKKMNDLSYILAEKENQIKRLKQDVDSESKKSLHKFIKAIHAPFDELNLVLAKEENKAIEMILNKLVNSLKENQIEIITPKIGDDFNSQIHNAIAQAKNEKYENGKIDGVMSSCYKVHDQVVAHAMVSVVNND